MVIVSGGLAHASFVCHSGHPLVPGAVANENVNNAAKYQSLSGSCLSSQSKLLFPVEPFSAA
jgi:hypothetical protein